MCKLFLFCVKSNFASCTKVNKCFWNLLYLSNALSNTVSKINRVAFFLNYVQMLLLSCQNKSAATYI